jgi:hypothetical protein
VLLGELLVEQVECFWVVELGLLVHLLSEVLLEHLFKLLKIE